jgi:hypothetical protein
MPWVRFGQEKNINLMFCRVASRKNALFLPGHFKMKIKYIIGGYFSILMLLFMA